MKNKKKLKNKFISLNIIMSRINNASSQSDEEQTAKDYSDDPSQITQKSAQNIKKTEDDDELEQRIKELILMTGGNGPKRCKQRKKEYLKKLENDNNQLRNIIVDLQQKINAYQSQKNIVLDQLRYFQGCLDQAAPFILQQNETKSKASKE